MLRSISIVIACPLAWNAGTGGRNLHFITFSCYQRLPLLSDASRRDLLLEGLENVRRRYRWVVLGYVVMPEHVHLLVSEPHRRPLATAMQALKLGFARRLLAAQRRRGTDVGRPHRIWQDRYHDFNVFSAKKRVEKLRYLHCNPVKRGLVEAPELWPWSSFRAYASEEQGPVRVNEWGVLTPKSRRPEAFPK